MKAITALTVYFKKGWLRDGLGSPFFCEALPVSESDYSFHGDWYKRFENTMASIIPPIWVPNYLTIFRLMVSAFLIGFGSRLPFFVLFIIIALGGLSDFFDGVIARSKNKKTRFGTVFDPIADKLLMLALLGVLVFQNTIGLFLVLLVGLAESHILVIPALSFAYHLFKNESPRPFTSPEKRVSPSLLGKIKMFFYVSGFLFLIVSRMIDSSAILAIGTQVLEAGIVTAFLALAHYAIRWVRDPY
ncbi:MAG: CDP-alcohol phosphatidyltransferase family protein [Deltaproteobacteria bacterium]|nr:CDP-alcohol phosphatidyltransferase family protein [Deltaproteobacteria bacterium]